jgi:hypothetical protein
MVPATYLKTMQTAQHRQWQEAVNAEIRSLMELETWKIVDRHNRFINYKPVRSSSRRSMLGRMTALSTKPV